MVLVPANCVRASKLRLGGNLRPAGDSRWGRKCASGRKPAFGLLSAFGPAKRVWPAKRVSPAEFEQCFTSKRLTTSKPTSRQQARSPNAPSHSGTMPTGEQAGPDGTPPKALNFPYFRCQHLLFLLSILFRHGRSCVLVAWKRLNRHVPLTPRNHDRCWGCRS